MAGLLLSAGEKGRGHGCPALGQLVPCLVQCYQGDRFLYDVAKVKGEMLDKITKAEVMCRFSGICTIDPRWRGNLLMAGLIV